MMVPAPAEPTYEPYRPPPVILHERVNPFDKNKAPTYDNKTSGIYSSLSSNTTPAVVKEEKPVERVAVAPAPEPLVQPAATTFSSTSGFDYSYRPPPLTTYTSKDTVEKQDSKASEVSVAPPRHKFERKLSDADIVFGSKPEPYTSTFKVENYSRNRSNSSFTSTSTDSEYMYGGSNARKDNPFQKSLSVSSEKDGDFASDPTVRTYTGIQNDAFTDYDTPKTTTGNKSWSNNDDDFDLK